MNKRLILLLLSVVVLLVEVECVCVVGLDEMKRAFAMTDWFSIHFQRGQRELWNEWIPNDWKITVGFNRRKQSKKISPS